MAVPSPRDREAAIAGRHLPLAMGFLLAGIAHLMVQGSTLATLRSASPLIAMGAFVALILGTSRLLIARIGRRRVVGPTWLAAVPITLVAAGSVGSYLTLADIHSGAGWLAPLWGAGLALHLALVAATLIGKGDGLPVESGAGTIAILAGAATYGLGSAVLLPVAVLGGLDYLAALHLLLPGFVVLTIVAVVVVVLPRFSGTQIPRPVAVLLATTGGLGPGGIALGLAGIPLALPIGASLETVALGTVGVGLLMSVFRASRWRDTHVLYGTSGLSALVGAGLGLAIAFGGSASSWAPVHGLVNLLGFVGGVILAASIDLYAPRWLPALDESPAYVWSVTVLHGLGVAFLAGGIAGRGWIHLGLACVGGAVLIQAGMAIRPLLGAIEPQPEGEQESSRG